MTTGDRSRHRQVRHLRERSPAITRTVPFLVAVLLVVVAVTWVFAHRGVVQRPRVETAYSSPTADRTPTVSASSGYARRAVPGTVTASTNVIPPEIEAGFARLTGTLRVRSAGLAYAPVGSSPLLLGTWEEGPAWSTVKVPMSLAALGRSDSAEVHRWVHRAITQSDNEAAKALWSQLGEGNDAAAAVDEVLLSHGDRDTRTQSQQIHPPYSPFGQTVWSLPDQVTFASALACSEKDRSVTEEMSQVMSAQRWGLGRLPSAAFKGGWGPDPQGRYLVRQFGVVTLNGHLVAVAMAVEPASGSFDDGVQALNRMSAWFEQSVHPATGGCA